VRVAGRSSTSQVKTEAVEKTVMASGSAVGVPAKSQATRALAAAPPSIRMHPQTAEATPAISGKGSIAP